MPTENLNIGDRFTSREVAEEGQEFIVHEFLVDDNDTVWIIGLTVDEHVPWTFTEDDVDDLVLYTQRVPNLKPATKKGKKK